MKFSIHTFDIDLHLNVVMDRAGQPLATSQGTSLAALRSDIYGFGPSMDQNGSVAILSQDETFGLRC